MISRLVRRRIPRGAGPWTWWRRGCGSSGCGCARPSTGGPLCRGPCWWVTGLPSRRRQGKQSQSDAAPANGSKSAPEGACKGQTRGRRGKGWVQTGKRWGRKWNG